MLKIIVTCMGFIGLFYIALDALKVPYLKSSRAVKSVLDKQRKKVSVLDVLLGDTATKLAHRIRLNEFKREELRANLQAAGIDISPEQFKANAIVKAVFAGLFAIPLFFVLPILSPVIIIGAFIIYRQENKKITVKVAQRREKIEAALPGFVSTVEKTLKHSRDVQYMIESYAVQAESPFRDELLITAADMRSGNLETAVSRLEMRIVSPQVSDVCRGLVAILRGDETSAYWSTLGVKFADENRQRLKRRAQKAPKKVKWLSVSLLVCFMLIYMVVIISQIISSVSVLFS